MAGAYGGSAIATYRTARAHETKYYQGVFQNPSTLASLPGPGIDSLLIRSNSLWIGSDSLTLEERQALGIGEGENWLVSTNGQKMRNVPSPE